MNRVVPGALYIILISLGLASLFNFLFFDKLPGISVFIFLVILLLAVFLFGLKMQLSLRKSWWMVILIMFFAIMPAIRANEFLIFLDVCAILGLLMLLAHQLTGTPAFLMRLQDYFMLAVLVPFWMLGRAILTISVLGQIHSNVKNRDTRLRVIKGVVMAAPILIVFSILFSEADLAFAQFLNGFFDINISERTVQYFMLLFLAFVASLSFFSYIFFPAKEEPSEPWGQSSATVQSGRGIEVMVFLGLISVLFLVFIGFQITYLFGGEANTINAGFTYAEYARQGFWELLAVAMLSLLVLLVSEKYAGTELKIDRRFLVPAVILIGEVAVIIISAFKRLSLYIDAYGMTLLRFYVAGFIMLLLVLFILLAFKFIKSKGEEFFTICTLLSVAGFLVIINLINPDGFIIRSNIEQYNRTGKIDVGYTQDLSADAVPGKIELYKKITGGDKVVLWDLLQKQKDRLQNEVGDWQSTNLSRTQALKLLNNLKE